MAESRRKNKLRTVDSFDDVVLNPRSLAMRYHAAKHLDLAEYRHRRETPMTSLEIPPDAYLDHVSSMSESMVHKGVIKPVDVGLTDLLCFSNDSCEGCMNTACTGGIEEVEEVGGEYGFDDTSVNNNASVQASPMEEKPVRQKKCMILVLIISFVLGIGLLVYGTIVGRKRKRSLPQGFRAVTPPTAAPIMWEGQPENLSSWLATLSRVTDPSTFVAGAAQTSALQWISTVDSQQLDLNSTDLTERYIAAVLYFATSGEKWSSQYNFLNGDSICSWNDGGGNGIGCDGNERVSTIFIADNMLQGTIPSEVSHLPNLETLDLYYNQLSGPFPDMSTLSSLRHMDVDGNLLTGTVPSELFNLPALESVFLLNNRGLTGTIPEITSTESRLLSVSVYDCSLNGQIPTSLAKATDLKFFQAFNNSLTGTIPSELSNLPSLELLSLGANDLTGTVPTFAGQTNLEIVSLGENSLTGTIPAMIASLPSLRILYLQDNQLTGTVPSNIGTMQTLENIWLFNNRLVGALPTFYSNPDTLQQVFLGNNRFSGGIIPLLQMGPSSIVFLDLGGNPELSGNVPSIISSFSSLIHFNVSYTGLSGTIPETISSLNLTVLALEGTGIVADLTNLVCDGGSVLPSPFSIVTADCAGSSPQVQCSCCTECLWLD